MIEGQRDRARHARTFHAAMAERDRERQREPEREIETERERRTVLLGPAQHVEIQSSVLDTGRHRYSKRPQTTMHRNKQKQST